ncbi:MAG TPA: hypothetical protein PLD54_01655, partial [Candidatus Levybacteria bacterium]|nr:hypothetical protein [Candidatus Levybacteria bacterium]
ITTDTIDSSNITDFLIGNIHTDSRTQFASELDMGFYTPVFEYLYGEQKLGYKASESNREKFLEKYNKWSDEEKEGAIAQHLFDHFNFQTSVERSAVVYKSMQGGQFGYTTANHGSVYSTNSEINEVIKEGGLPILEVHTHPDDALFSPIDYWRMLINIGGDNSNRLLNGSVVLCPSRQLMALATANTPILSGEEIDQLIAGIEIRNSNPKRVNQLANRWDIMLNSLQRTLKENDDEFNAIRLKRGDGIITPEEYEKLYSDLLDRYVNYFERYWRTKFHIDNFNLSYEERMANNLVVDFAREINVKLYVSDNMKDFHEFSL